MGLPIGPLPAGTGLGMAIFSSQMRDGGTRCSSCYKESFQYSSLPRTCACTHTDTPVHTALMQIREHMHRHVSRTETCIWVCTHTYAQRHTPTYLQTCVQYSGVHRLAHTHLVQALPNTQRPACTPGPPSVHSGCTGRVRIISSESTPGPCVHTDPVLAADTSPRLALRTMPAWSSQPSGYTNKQATTTQWVEQGL